MHHKMSTAMLLNLYRELTVLTGEGTVLAIAMEQNGNCLFTAVVHQMCPDLEINSERFIEMANSYRQICATEMRKNLSKYKESIKEDLTANPQYTQKTQKGKIDAYLRNIKSGNEWGGYSALVALSVCLKVSIKVLNEVRPKEKLNEAQSTHIDNPEEEKQIAIVYRVSLCPEERQKEQPKRNHYDSFKNFLSNT